jgi:hypothetical protein
VPFLVIGHRSVLCSGGSKGSVSCWRMAIGLPRPRGPLWIDVVCRPAGRGYMLLVWTL